MKVVKTVNISYNIDVTDEDIRDIVCTALEGGIGYWACLDNTGPNWVGDKPVSEKAADILLNGGTLHFYDAETKCDEYNIDLGMLISGIARYVSDGKTDIIDEEKHLMCWNIDASIADEIFQYGIFAELLFG